MASRWAHTTSLDTSISLKYSLDLLHLEITCDTWLRLIRCSFATSDSFSIFTMIAWAILHLSWIVNLLPNLRFLSIGVVSSSPSDIPELWSDFEEKYPFPIFLESLVTADMPRSRLTSSSSNNCYAFDLNPNRILVICLPYCSSLC